MIIPHEKELSKIQIDEISGILSEFKCSLQTIAGATQTIYAIIGDESSQLLVNRIEGLPYVARVERVQAPYKLLAKGNEHARTQFKLGNRIVGQDFVVIAGPCAVDHNNPNYLYETAHALKEAGIDALRGGVWKPRTSPYAFQGNAKSIEVLLEARSRYGLEIVTEVMELEEVKLCVEAKVDVLQVGARNALNYRLLSQIGKLTTGTSTRVLLKRSMHMGPIDEFILAAEYVAGNGNPQVMLCPRGTLPAMQGYRNYPDESITQLLKEKTWAPVVVDPSHSVGRAKYVPRAALAAAAYGADGVVIESHCAPVKGLGDDPKQAVSPEIIAKLIPELRAIWQSARKFEF